MSSRSLTRWTSQRVRSLDEIEHAHRSVGGTGRGRRYATQQINRAYAVLLSSQLQGYSRDLHSESVDHLVRVVTPITFQNTVRLSFQQGLKLDHGNPNAGNLGSDFGRLGLVFWTDVEAELGKKQYLKCRAKLDHLNEWRNAIAHESFDPTKLGGTSNLGVGDVRSWRRVVERLVVTFDVIMRSHIRSVIGTAPW